MSLPVLDGVHRSVEVPAPLRASRRAGSGRDAGSAAVEFVTLAVLLLVPLVYLTVLLGRVQAATFAADGAAREAARVFVAASREDEGRAAAAAVTRMALRDQGLGGGRDRAAGGTVTVDCSTRPCLEPGALVTALVEVDVVLPGVPRGLDRVVPVHVTVRARQGASVDAHRIGVSRPDGWVGGTSGSWSSGGRGRG